MPLREAFRRFLERPYEPASDRPARIEKGDRMTPVAGTSLRELAARSPIAQAIAELVFDAPHPPATPHDAEAKSPHGSGSK